MRNRSSNGTLKRLVMQKSIIESFRASSSPALTFSEQAIASEGILCATVAATHTLLVDVRKKREDATAMQAEGMKMLQDGFAKKDMSKVSAANVLLSKSSEMLQQVNEDVPKKKSKKD